jgi:protein O-GlcNAc transferase
MATNKQMAELQAAMAHQKAGRLADAAKVYKRLLREMPGNFGCIYSLAMIYAQQGSFDSAADMFRRAAQIRPDLLDAHYNLALALSMAGRSKEAALSYETLLKINPQHAAARNNYAATLLQDGHAAEALQQYDLLVAAEPGNADLHNNRGMALQNLKRLAEAVLAYEKAVELRPDFAEAYVNRGNALAALRRYEEALQSFRQATARRPDFAEAHTNAGNILLSRGSFTGAVAEYDSALSMRPGDSETKSMRLYAKMHLCDWTDGAKDSAELAACIRQDMPVYPFVALAALGSASDQLRCARLFAKTRFAPSAPPLWRGAMYRHDRIRVAYLSGDFREHAVGYLLPGLLERHDRSRFEVTALSFGSDQDSPLRRRLKNAVEHFVDVDEKTDQHIAELVRDRETAILVDLMGYTQNARTAILARRPAPLAVSYLGFLGTMGADFIDYVMADAIALPFDQQEHYRERIIHLPDCFLVNDDRLAIAANTPTRREESLPDSGFVFCSFNNTYKLTPQLFAIWMRILRIVDGSVLWLAESHPDTHANLLGEARRAGIDDSRLVFARRVPLDQHLARQRLADLFLDTTPYNAGATAAAALWSGVPVLTVLGHTFAGRMAASMLHGVGLPELITGSLDDYEALALKIAAEPALCAALKQKLAHNRSSCPLFDTARSTQAIEAAYTAMWRGYQNGRPARGFAVKTDP